MDESRLLVNARFMNIRARSSLNDEYFKRLADDLMLDELLCGEADPLEFLKDTIICLGNKIKAEQLESQLKELKK